MSIFSRVFNNLSSARVTDNDIPAHLLLDRQLALSDLRVSVLTCVLGAPESLHLTYASLQPFLSPRLTWNLKFGVNSPASFRAKFEGDHVIAHAVEDDCLYQAMSQGLNLLDADFYFVLGAGDELHATGAMELIERMVQAPKSAAFFAPITDASGDQVWMPEPEDFPVRMSCPHPGAVLRVDNSRALGGFDSRYQIAADYDHLSRYVLAYGTGNTIDMPLVRFAGGGMSEVRAFEGKLEEELIRMRVWKSHEYAVQSRLLRHSAMNACSLFDQVADQVGKSKS